MNLFAEQNIPLAGSNDIVFRISLRGPLISLLIFLVGLFVGVALFIYSYRLSVTWGMILSGVYSLIMGGICHILLRTLRATPSPANWLTRISSGGILLKHRSYLHDNSPKEDPIALHLSWYEIADVQLQQELYTTTYIDEKSELRRWFLSIKLDPRYISIDKIKAALDFENLRKPAHFRIDDLKHDLFIARKNKAADSEIARIKQEIALEKNRHPGRHNKTYFRDRPVTFVNPDKLRGDSHASF